MAKILKFLVFEMTTIIGQNGSRESNNVSLSKELLFCLYTSDHSFYCSIAKSKHDSKNFILSNGQNKKKDLQ